MKNVLITGVLLILLAACSSSNDESASNKNERTAITEAVNQPLDKAKGVEQQILDNAAEQRKQADDL